VSGPPAAESRELRKTFVAGNGDFVPERVESRCGSAEWSPPEASKRYGIVFLRRAASTGA
jgi:hypothetical protein